MVLSVSSLFWKQENLRENFLLSLIQTNKQNLGMVSQAGNRLLWAQRQANPWGTLVSQFSQEVSSTFRGRDSHKKHKVERNKERYTVLAFGVSAYIGSFMHIYTHKHKLRIKTDNTVTHMNLHQA